MQLEQPSKTLGFKNGALMAHSKLKKAGISPSDQQTEIISLEGIIVACCREVRQECAIKAFQAKEEYATY